MSSRNKKQIIARCDRQGNIIGEIERWEAHKKGILHRAFTLAITYRNFYILQHRKHPVFDGVFDITSSSHQIMKNGKLEETLHAADRTLYREWNIKPGDVLGKMKLNGAIYYKAKDTNSIYTEHEYCDIVELRVKKIPEPNFDVAYGYSLISQKDLGHIGQRPIRLWRKKARTYSLLAPWVKKAIEEKLI